MPSWIDEQIVEQHRQDALRRAERQRIVIQVQAARPGLPRFYALPLARLGERLVAWGYRLQLRYGAISEPPVVVRTGRNTSGC
jgi:hypothetical protein